jgi:membrane protein YqaA with SNARE-associated domain
VALSSELVGFVKAGLERGLPREQLRDALLQAGWPSDQVSQALAGFADVQFPIPVPRPSSAASSRETFMYVVMFATLIVSAYSLGNLIFELINRMLPDPAQQAFGSTLQAIRWSLASVIVAFPIFVYVASLIDREVRAHPIKRASRVRKQLTYVTLFIASFVLIGDVITVVYNFLGGELTLRFLLKVLTVGAIAGSVFGYYLRDLRAGEAAPET